MKNIGFALITLLFMSGSLGAELMTATHGATDKQRASLWYDAFNRKDPSLLEELLDPYWIDIPSGPGQPTGLPGAREALLGLTTAFPDLKVTIAEILQDGDKVVVRSNITGTHMGNFLGIAATRRKLSIQAVDIHQFKDGRIVRTWHTEDWMSGLRQLGALR
jgi:steroid delta-isomerase-like uncharacterized protein